MLLPNSVHLTDRLKKKVYTTYVQTRLGRIQWQLLLTSKYDRTIQAIWFRFRLHLNRNNYGNENTIDTYESIRTICNSEINFFVLLFTVKSNFESTCESCLYLFPLKHLKFKERLYMLIEFSSKRLTLIIIRSGLTFIVLIVLLSYKGHGMIPSIKRDLLH